MELVQVHPYHLKKQDGGGTMSNIYFISDTHFDHANIIPYARRPYRDVKHMNEELIKNWNSIVNNDDTVFHIGDAFWYPSVKNMKPIMEQLNGTIYLIRGNHDTATRSMYIRSGFADVYDEIIIDSFLLTHHPMWGGEFKKRQEQDSITHNICGHVHLNLHFLYSYNICVCVELIDYRPISFEKIKQMITITWRE